MVSSLGFHTLTISMRLTIKESQDLYNVFSKDKGLFLDSKEIVGHSTYYNFYYSKHSKIGKGLSWTLRSSTFIPEYISSRSFPYSISESESTPCSVKATINPKILIGMEDYIMAADARYLDDFIKVFNQIVSNLSPILQDFSFYSLNRIDYCINFDLRDLGIDCLPQDYMLLIRQSDIPHHFMEDLKYNSTSHRKQSGTNRFYLKNNSLNINCYLKHHQLKHMYPNTPNIEDSRYIIRFEIQCSYLKTRYLMKQIKNRMDFEMAMAQMLSDDRCRNILLKYYDRIIGKGDYYSLNSAKAKVKSMNYRQNKEKRLIRALELVNQSRGVYKAKSKLTDTELDYFKQSLKDLNSIGVNPVTIPRERGIKHLPNLMTTYLTQKEEQYKQFEEYHHEPYFKQYNPMSKKL